MGRNHNQDWTLAARTYRCAGWIFLVICLAAACTGCGRQQEQVSGNDSQKAQTSQIEGWAQVPEHTQPATNISNMNGWVQILPIDAEADLNKETIPVIHPADSLPQEEYFKDKWYGCQDGQLFCVQLDTGKISVLAQLPERLTDSCFTVCKGRYVYLVSATDKRKVRYLWVVDTYTQEVKEVCYTYPYMITDVMVVNDTIYLSAYDGYGAFPVGMDGIPDMEAGRTTWRNGNRAVRWLCNPFFMRDIYGYDLGYLESGYYPVVTDVDSGEQWMLPGTFPDNVNFSDVFYGNTYILFSCNGFPIDSSCFLLSLEDGSIKQIYFNGTPYRMEDNELYYVAETNEQLQIWCMELDTGKTRKLSVEECTAQKIPDSLIYEIKSDNSGTYLYRADCWQEMEWDSSSQRIAVLAENTEELWYKRRQSMQEICLLCGKPYMEIHLNMIVLRPRTEGERKIAEAIKMEQEEERTFLYHVLEDENYMATHMTDENGICMQNGGYSDGYLLNTEVFYESERHLCLEFLYQRAFMGLHSIVRYQTYDRMTGDLLELPDIVDYTQEEWKAVVRERFIEEGYQENGKLPEGIEERLGWEMHFALTKEGILIYFFPNEVCGYSESSIVLPYNQLQLKMQLQQEDE